MTTLVNTTHPFLRIVLPDDAGYAVFTGGRLEVSEDDPYYEHIMGVATSDPFISVMVNETTCLYCGEVFRGDKAKDRLEKHMKQIHFDLWQKQLELDQAKVVQKEIKARAGYACDVCSPVQTFGSEDELAIHARLHTAPPELDAEGNTRGGEDGEDRRPGERTRQAPAAPRARASTRQRSS